MRTDSVESGVRTEVRDAIFVTALLVLALLGFETTYGDSRYLVVGVAGIVLGLVVAVVCRRMRAPAVAVAATTVLVFFLFGGAVALSGLVADGVVPSRASLQALADGALHGWQDLLTVLPPVGSSGNVLAIPYLLGLSGAVLALSLARTPRYAFWPVLPPVIVLALSILFGGAEPAALVLQGAVFSAVALAWMAVRSRRHDQVVTRPSRRRQLSGLTLVVAAAAGAVLLGPLMPLASSEERVVLRKHVEPPLDLRHYVSPLTTYRKYVVPEEKSAGRAGLGEQTLFTVEGLPAGALIRIATMDAYDGTVWNVAGSASASVVEEPTSSGSFQRVGETIPTRATGPRASVTFTLGMLGGIWLPTVGAVTGVRFDGDNADYLERTFRYNRATDSAVAATLPADDPVTLQPGDRYTVDVVLPQGARVTQPADSPALQAAGPAGFRLPPPARVPEAVKARTDEVASGTDGTFAKVQALADELRRGAYSSGTEGEIPSLAGHYAARLDRMVSDPQGLVGDAEQYAAVMALMARELGIPARVVMGVKPPEGAAATLAVKGTDLTAWVEIGLDGIGWVPVFPTPPSTAKKPQTVPRPKPITRVQEPPKAVVAPRVAANPLISAGEPTEQKAPERRVTKPAVPAAPDRANRGGGGSLLVAAGVGGLAALVILAVLVTVAVKSVRRRRRRSRGSPSARIAGGWAEVVDLVTDTGVVVPPKGTRREVAVFLDHAPLVTLARRADSAVFAPGEPSEREVADYWADVATARRDITGRLGPWAKLRLMLSLRSLRR